MDKREQSQVRRGAAQGDNDPYHVGVRQLVGDDGPLFGRGHVVQESSASGRLLFLRPPWLRGVWSGVRATLDPVLVGRPRQRGEVPAGQRMDRRAAETGRHGRRGHRTRGPGVGEVAAQADRGPRGTLDLGQPGGEGGRGGGAGGRPIARTIGHLNTYSEQDAESVPLRSEQHKAVCEACKSTWATTSHHIQRSRRFFLCLFPSEKPLTFRQRKRKAFFSSEEMVDSIWRMYFRNVQYPLVNRNHKSP